MQIPFNVDIGKFGMFSNVTDIGSMFLGMQIPFKCEIGDWDVPNVVDNE